MNALSFRYGAVRASGLIQTMGRGLRDGIVVLSGAVNPWDLMRATWPRKGYYLLRARMDEYAARRRQLWHRE